MKVILVPRNSLIESLPRRFATASSKASNFASDYYRGLPEDYWLKYRDRAKAVTAAEVQRVAHKYPPPEKLVYLAFWPDGRTRRATTSASCATPATVWDFSKTSKYGNSPPARPVIIRMRRELVAGLVMYSPAASVP
jgi:hypothetical protein